jgi:signal transduction histidine kinase
MSRILIVDDHEPNLYLLRVVLQGAGYTVDEAQDGAEALAKARNLPPQLVISDLLMPVMDGYTLLREWKADPRLSGVPFVVYTATYSEPQDRKLAMDLGADAYVLKATEPDALIARIRDVLAGGARTAGESARAASTSDPRMKAYSEILVRKLEDKMLEVKGANQDLEAANARLRQLSQRLLEVQEAERAAIARELHDEIGQSLTAIKLAVQRVMRRGESAELGALTECVELVSRALSQVRNRALELRPAQLDQLGLSAALRDLTERIAASAELESRFESDGQDVRPGYAQATAAFRVAQEALTNVVRHAEARRVVVEVRRHGGELIVTVRDDGRAFDVEEARSQAVRGRSMGLLGMEERVRLAGGWLRIESRPGEGTRVEAGFPIDEHPGIPA